MSNSGIADKKLPISQRNEIAAFEVAISRIQANTGLTVMEAILFHCSNSDIEVELVSKLLSNQLKAKLKKEAAALHFLKVRKPRVPKKT
jgi:hypothetical protein